MFWRRKRLPGPDFIIFGLGNPGINYMRSRHNVGWWVLDELARRHAVEKSVHRHKGQADYCRIHGLHVVLVKPTTFMNLSGACVAAWLKEFASVRFALVFDDITLGNGKVRIRRDGRAGGHNGVQSVIEALGTGQFDRIKIGVGSPNGQDAADYVLEPPHSQEVEQLQPAIKCAADALELLARDDYEAAQAVIARQAQTQQAGPPPGPEK